MFAPVPAPISPILTVPSSPALCDGDVAAGLGHPRIYLDLAATGSAVCPYCSRRFVLAEGARPAGGH
jgi:uncharacterized Zn-finger protein